MLSALILTTQILCPSKHATLTIQDVMMNFGRYISTADSLVTAGQATDEQINAAVADLQVAEVCAQAVVDGSTEELLPAGAHKLASAARDAYIVDFKQTMAKFVSALKDYEKSLSRHDLDDAKSKKKIASDIADDAHSRF